MSIGEKQTILVLKNMGSTLSQIGDAVSCSRQTAFRTIKQFKTDGHFLPKPKSGRPKKVTAQHEAEIIRLVEEDRRRTAGEINFIMQQQDPSFKVHNDHIGRILRKNGYFGRVCSKKTLLRPPNMVKRLAFARKHVNKPLSFWRSVLFTDEKKVELFNTKRRQYCRRKKGEGLRPDTIQPTVKHGGGHIMVWGCLMGGKVGSIYQVEGILEKNQMLSILENYAIPSGLRLGGRGFVFQQDNDPKHTSKVCKDFLKSKINDGTLHVLEWPSQSPDLNPLELIWDEVDRQVQKLRATNKALLWQAVQEAWGQISKETLLKCVDRVPRILKAVIQAEGGYFDEKYAPRKFKHQEVY
jgi:transposase